MISETSLQIVKERGSTSDYLQATGYHLQDMPILRPGIDWIDGTLYMTFPLDRDETSYVGRGKERKEIVKRITSTILVRGATPSAPALVRPYEEEHIKDLGFRFPPTFTQGREGRWSLGSIIDYVDGRAPALNPADLFRELREVYTTYVEFPDDKHYDIATLFLMGTYVYRLFDQTTYLHFNGTRASGKSQNLRILAALGFNTVWSSNMSAAALFRTVSGNPGLLCIDEAESFESEKGQEIRQLILAGYMAGSIVARTERGPNDVFQVTKYEVYSPKAIASINPLDPTMASRCIVIPMETALRRIPDFTMSDPRWSSLRDQLYTFAFQQATNIARIRQDWVTKRIHLADDLTGRPWEISQTLIVLADLIGGETFAGDLIAFLRNYFASAAKQVEDSDRQFTLLKCLPRVLATKAAHPGGYYSVKDIHEVVSSYIDEDTKDFYKTRTVGRHLLTLNFKDKKVEKGGTQYRINEADVRAAMRRRRITPFPEDELWFAEQQSYAHVSDSTPTAEPAKADDRLSWLSEWEEPDTGTAAH